MAMQTRTKSAFLLLAVLALGILIGFLVSGALQNRRMRSIAHLRTGPGFAELVERVIQPRSEEQREQIRDILDGAAPRIADLFEQHRGEMSQVSDSVMTELEAILDPEQVQRLRRMKVRMRDGPPEGRRGRPGAGRPRGPRPEAGPPQGGPPPEGEPPPE
jgi:hypothetical protein